MKNYFKTCLEPLRRCCAPTAVLVYYRVNRAARTARALPERLETSFVMGFNHQRGFSLVAAMFLVIIVGMIAGYMVNISNVQRVETSIGLMGMRANAAAASGMEWAVASTLSANRCPTNTSFGLTGNAFNGFTVTTQCSARAVTEGARSYSTFRLTTIASFGRAGQEDFYQRALVASVANPPP
jgi:MSHA biogenesis protein MshP